MAFLSIDISIEDVIAIFNQYHLGSMQLDCTTYMELLNQIKSIQIPLAVLCASVKREMIFEQIKSEVYLQFPLSNDLNTAVQGMPLNPPMIAMMMAWEETVIRHTWTIRNFGVTRYLASGPLETRTNMMTPQRATRVEQRDSNCT